MWHCVSYSKLDRMLTPISWGYVGNRKMGWRVLEIKVSGLPSDSSFICLRFKNSDKLESFSESSFQRKALKDFCFSRFPELLDNGRGPGISQPVFSFFTSCTEAHYCLLISCTEPKPHG